MLSIPTHSILYSNARSVLLGRIGDRGGVGEGREGDFESWSGFFVHESRQFLSFGLERITLGRDRHSCD